MKFHTKSQQRAWAVRAAALIAFIVVLASQSALAQEAWQLDFDAKETGSIAISQTPFGTCAHYVPRNARDILVLAHGYPWPDDSRTMPQLVEHITAYARRWKDFADAQGLVLIIPAFGSGPFNGYRELFGTQVDPDDFVNALVDEYGAHLGAPYDGTFYLYGHSAGGQFAARFAVTHPWRLKGVVLSAPGRYAFPNPDLEWPNGMAAMTRDEALSGSAATGKHPLRAGGTRYQPLARGWAYAASSVPIAIVIGSADTEPRPPTPGHRQASRIEYAQEWIAAMNALSEQQGSTRRVALFMVDGVAHDPVALTPQAMEVLKSWMSGTRN